MKTLKIVIISIVATLSACQDKISYYPVKPQLSYKSTVTGKVISFIEGNIVNGLVNEHNLKNVHCFISNNTVTIPIQFNSAYNYSCAGYGRFNGSSLIISYHITNSANIQVLGSTEELFIRIE